MFSKLEEADEDSGTEEDEQPQRDVEGDDKSRTAEFLGPVLIITVRRIITSTAHIFEAALNFSIIVALLLAACALIYFSTATKYLPL